MAGCKTEEEMVQVWKKKVLRKVIRRKKRSEVGIRRVNAEIAELYGKLSIKGDINAHSLRWLGRIQPIPERRTPKVIFWQFNMRKKEDRKTEIKMDRRSRK